MSDLQRPGWQIIDAWQQTTPAKFRACFLEFLERWPQKKFHGQVIDDVLRSADGYSLWHLSVGVSRTVMGNSLVNRLRRVWLLSVGLKSGTSATQALVYGVIDQVVTVVVNKLFEIGISTEYLSGSKKAKNQQWRASRRWKSLLRPWKTLWNRRRQVKLAQRMTQAFAEPQGETPTVLFASRYLRHVAVDGDQVTLNFWSEISAELERRRADIAQRFLVRFRGTFDGYQPQETHHEGWQLLRNAPGNVGIRDRYLAVREWRASLRHYYRLSKWLAKLEKDKDFQASFRFADCDISSLVVPMLRRAVERITEWALDVGASKKAIESLGNVRAMVLSEEFYKFTQSDLAAAHQLGIPTCGIQHGTIYKMHLVYTPPKGTAANAPLPDYFAAYGAYARETVSEIGSFPAERVLETGAPRLDDLARESISRDDARRELELPQNAKVILITTQTFGWFPRVVQAALEAAKNHPEWYVCIKVHPKPTAKPVGEYLEMAREAGVTNVAGYKTHFRELLAACDVLVSVSSTTVLEAILKRRWAVCANFSGEPDAYPYVEDGGALGAGTTEELARALQTLLNGKDLEELESRRQSFLERHAGPAADGKATETFVDRLLELVDTGSIVSGD